MNTSDFKQLRERYVAIFKDDPTSETAIEGIESALGMTLPDDLKKISTFFSGGIANHFTIRPEGPYTLVNETQRLRSAIQLPHRFVFLAEPAESAIFLDCKAGTMGGPAVIWCDAHDVGRLNDLESMSPPPHTWLTYSAFFEYLLDIEEEERNEV